MIEPLQFILIACCLILAAVVTVYVVRDREPDWTLLAVTGFVEVLTLVQTVIGLVQISRGDHQVAGAVFVGYLLSIAVILPIAFFWALAERSRGSTAVMLVAALTVAFLVVRLGQVWGAGA